jgi:apolipoprotein N-acyltransferase
VLPALAFGATWALSEWLRGVVFTGFPWLGSGYPHTDGPLAGFAPLIGVYGISALAGFIAALLVAVVGAIGRQRKARSAVLAGGLAVGVLACGAALAPIQYTSPIGQPIHVRLLQGNVAQDIKFEPVGIERSLELYRDLITEAPADLVVTPETAFPVILQELPVEIARAVRTFMEKTGTTIIFGAAGADSPVDFTNSVFAIGPEQDQLYRYNKHHLVPFGEFIPFGFRWFVDMMKCRWAISGAARWTSRQFRCAAFMWHRISATRICSARRSRPRCASRQHRPTCWPMSRTWPGLATRSHWTSTFRSRGCARWKCAGPCCVPRIRA